MSVVGLDSHVEGNAHGKSHHEANESGGASQVLVELLFRDIAVGQVGEERGKATCRLDLPVLLLLLFEGAGLLRKHGHGDVVRTTEGLLGGNGRFDLTGHRRLGNVDNGIVSMVSRVADSGRLFAHALLSDFDKNVVTVVSLVLSDWLDSAHAVVGGVDKNVVSTALVVGRGLVVIRGGVFLVAGLKLVALSLGGALSDGLISFHGAHELEDGGSSDKSADGTDLLNQAANCVSILVGGSFDTSFSLGDDESPDGNGQEAERLLVLVSLSFLV